MKKFAVFLLQILVISGFATSAFADSLTLEQYLQTFYNEENEEYLSLKCDVAIKPLKFNIVRALDAKSEEIKKYKNSLYSNNTDPNIEIINYGSAKFSKRKIKNQVLNKWKSSNGIYWADILNDYNDILLKPSTIKEWVALDSYVKDILPDDEGRIVDKRNFSIVHSDQEVLKKAISEVKTCVDNQRCLDLRFFSVETVHWLFAKHYYPSDIIKLTKATDPKIFRKLLETFYKDLIFDFDRSFGLAKNNHEVVGKYLVVRMDLSAFAPDEKKLAKDIEAYWSTSELPIKVLTQKKEGYSFFKVILSDLEQRGVVYYKRQIMIINPNMSFSRMMHEFGHVLGLKDEYFTIWNEEKCGYSVQYNSGNIMSKNSGNILPEHIQAVKSIYFESTQR